LDKIDVLIETL